MSEFRILDSNWFFDTSTNLSASSEATDFPVENLKSHQRSKVWRSQSNEEIGGNFVITTSNNKIDIDEGSGEINVTATPGTYSASQLGTHLSSQLTAASGLAYAYAVNYDYYTGFWTIESTGSFELLWDTGTNTATSVGETLGFDTTSDTISNATHTGARVAIHTEEWVVLDLITTEAVDSFALIFDAVDGINLSSSAVVKIQANATNAWSSPAVDVTLAIDEDYDIYTYRWASSQSYRFWRVLIVDPQNANLYVELNVAVLSLATQLSQMPSIGFEQNLIDLSKKQENDYGNQFFDVYPSRREITFNHIALPEDDLETLYHIYRRVGKVTPICVWLDPSGDVFDKDRFFIYGRLQGNFKATQNFYTFFESELTVQEAL